MISSQDESGENRGSFFFSTALSALHSSDKWESYFNLHQRLPAFQEIIKKKKKNRVQLIIGSKLLEKVLDFGPFSDLQDVLVFALLSRWSCTTFLPPLIRVKI